MEIYWREGERFRLHQRVEKDKTAGSLLLKGFQVQLKNIFPREPIGGKKKTAKNNVSGELVCGVDEDQLFAGKFEVSMTELKSAGATDSGSQNVTGVVFDLKKYAVHDGPGIRTTVFLKGCPLRCWWCQNPESQKPGVEEIRTIHRRKTMNLSYAETREVIGREVTAEEIVREILKDSLFYDESGGGVTISGGEPLMQPAFLQELLKQLKLHELPVALDTTGYAPWSVLESILPLVDLFLYDLKFIDDELHRRYTGVPVERILKNLQQLIYREASVRVRIPIIPGITDTEENIHALMEFIENLKTIARIDLLPYNFMAAEKYSRLGKPYALKHIEPPDRRRMEELQKIFEKTGCEVTIGG